jgi:hypothetical protein
VGQELVVRCSDSQCTISSRRRRGLVCALVDEVMPWGHGWKLVVCDRLRQDMEGLPRPTSNQYRRNTAPLPLRIVPSCIRSQVSLTTMFSGHRISPSRETFSQTFSSTVQIPTIASFLVAHCQSDFTESAPGHSPHLYLSASKPKSYWLA